MGCNEGGIFEATELALHALGGVHGVGAARAELRVRSCACGGARAELRGRTCAGGAARAELRGAPRMEERTGRMEEREGRLRWEGMNVH